MKNKNNLLYNKKKRSTRSLQRKINNRAPYDVVLIVCEGQKTEPNYFKGLRDNLKLNNANIKITHCLSASDPISIVESALQEYEKDKSYNKIFCVFDKEHSNYQKALEKINAHSTNGIPIQAIPSVPCIEYWFLLHFKDSDRPYAQSGSKSPGDQVISELKRYLKDYSKGYENIFEKTKNLLSTAIARAKKIDRLQKKNKTDNPSTKIYHLIEYLMNIKK